MTTLIDLLSANYAPIQSSILSNLNAGDVTALTRTCRSFADLWPTLRATDYNINLRLRKLFKDPRQFRSVQGQGNALIIGHEARWFLLRSRSTFSDLMITVGHENSAPLMTYLESEGYIKKEAEADTDTNNTEEPPDWITYVKSSVEATNHVYVYRNLCALFGVIDNSGSTAEFNFISWNKAFSLHPYATFIEQEAFLLLDSSDKTRVRCAIYLEAEEIELKMLRSEDGGAVDQRNLAVGRRRIGDKHTWIIKLDIEGVQHPGRSDAILESSTFGIRRYNHLYHGAPTGLPQEEVPRFKIDCMSFSQPCLRNWLVAECEIGDMKNGGELSQFRQYGKELWAYLDRVTLLEMRKIPEARSPPEYLQLLHKEVTATELRDKFTLPRTWSFCDDEMAKLLTQAWTTQLKLDKEEEWREQERLETERLEKERRENEQNARLEATKREFDSLEKVRLEREHEQNARLKTMKREFDRLEEVRLEEIKRWKQKFDDFPKGPVLTICFVIVMSLYCKYYGIKFNQIGR